MPIQTSQITTESDGDLSLNPNGTGKVVLTDEIGAAKPLGLSVDGEMEELNTSALDVLPSDPEDSDLLIVQRSGAQYRVSATDIGGSPTANPDPLNVTAVPPFVSGSGTLEDPYVCTPATVSVPGGSENTVQLITISDQRSFAVGRFVDLSTGTGVRFTQPAAQFDNTGTWTGRLSYLDTPDSTSGAVFDGLLKMGDDSVYFAWEVTQIANQTVFAPADSPTASPPSVDYAYDNKYGTVSGSYADAPGTLTATGAAQFTVAGGLATTSNYVSAGEQLGILFDAATIDAASQGAIISGTISGPSGFFLAPSIIVDRNAEAFTPGALTSAATSSVITSSNVPIQGINCKSFVTLGAATLTSVQASINGAAYAAIPTSGTTMPMNPGDTLQLRGTTGADAGTAYTAEIKVGTTVGTWSVTTTGVTPAVSQPSITNPVNGSTGLIPDVDLVSSSYVANNGAGAHASSDWEVYQADLVAISTSVITAVDDTTPSAPVITLADNTNLSQLAPGIAVAQNSGGAPETSAITDISDRGGQGPESLFSNQYNNQTVSAYSTVGNVTLIAYGGSISDSGGYLVTATLSGSNIIYGSPVELPLDPGADGFGNPPYNAYFQITYDEVTDRFVVTYWNNKQEYFAIVAQVTGTVVTLGNEVSLEALIPNSVISNTPAPLTACGSGNALICISTQTAGGVPKPYSVVARINANNSLSFGTTTLFLSPGNGGVMQSALYDPVEDLVVVFWRDNGTVYGKANVIRVNSAAFTNEHIGQAIFESNQVNYYIAGDYDASSGSMVVTYQDKTLGNITKVIAGTVNNTTPPYIEFGDKTVVSNSTSTPSTASYDSFLGGVVITYDDDSNNKYAVLASVVGSGDTSSVTVGPPTQLASKTAGPLGVLTSASTSYNSVEKSLILTNIDPDGDNATNYAYGSTLQLGSTVTLTNNTNIANFGAGDLVTQTGGSTTGVVASAYPSTNTIVFGSTTGTWSVGNTITGPTLPIATGTVASANTSANTITLSSSTGRWLITESGYDSDKKLNQTVIVPSITNQVPSAPTSEPPDSGTYTQVVDDAGDVVNLTSYALDETIVIAGKAYYSRVRYNSADGTPVVSPFSLYNEFVSKETFAPTGWVATSSPTQTKWFGPAYGAPKAGTLIGQDMFVALGHSNQIMQSTDGVTWTSMPNCPTDGSWQRIVYGEGVFVIISGTQCYWSSNLTNWNQSSPPSLGVGTAIAYGNDMFVAVGATPSGPVGSYSYDGANWTSLSNFTTTNYYAAAYGGGKFVVLGADVQYSTDGINWTTASVPSYSGILRPLVYGNGKFVGISSGSTGSVLTSTDGINWTSAPIPEVLSVIGNTGVGTLTFGNGYFVAFSAGGATPIAYSTDGVNWTGQSAPVDNNWSASAYGGNTFVALALPAISGGTGNQQIMYCNV